MKGRAIAVCITAGIFATAITGCSQAWERQKKDIESNYGGGLNRVVEVYSENGKLLKTYSGKMDIEKKNGRLKFIDSNKESHMIYLGNSTTVIVDEVKEKKKK